MVVSGLPEIAPIIPTSAAPFDRPGWVYEEKVDGWRIVAYKRGEQVRLMGRRGVDHRGRFPDLTQAIAGLPAANLILDGEVAMYDDQLVSRFHLLWTRSPDGPTTPPLFLAFDCLHLNGRDLRPCPLRERRAILDQEIRNQRLVLPVRRLSDDGLDAWAEVQRRRYEGYVAKEAGAAYRSSTRWLKVKLRQEGRFVIGGVAMARAGHQGGVLVGEWDGERLLYRGFVDLGLSRGALEALGTTAQPLARPTSPFADLPRRREALWLEPVLQAEVSYGRIVGGQLREPVLRRFVVPRPPASRARSTPDLLPGTEDAEQASPGGAAMTTKATKRSAPSRKSGERDTVTTKNATMYAKRTAEGRFKEMTEKGRSLTADRRVKAKTTVQSGFGDQGDRPTKR